jgi:hypothetical protein
MHHSLRFYSGHRPWVLRLYIFGGRLTRLPLLGRLVRWLANRYGRTMHRNYLLTPAEAEALLEAADGLAAGPCDCRKVFRNCDNPLDNEIILGPTRHILLEAMSPEAREITRDEAREILRDSHQRGLIHTIARCRGDFYAICNCCSCCCLPLRLSKQYGIGEALVRHDDIVGEFREYQLAYRDEP